MIELYFDHCKIELSNESNYAPNSTDNVVAFEKTFGVEEGGIYHSTKHGIKIYKNGKLLGSVLVCAVGGATGIHETSAVTIKNNILICCADSIFSLSLPDLSLNWMKKVDDATCFQIFNTENGIFVHGELKASKIDEAGNIIWSAGFADILVTPDGKKEFIFHDNFIEIEDWNRTKYKLDFDGNFI